MGGADVSRTVWRVADNLEKTLLCNFLFSWAKIFKTRYLYNYVGFHMKYNIIEP